MQRHFTKTLLLYFGLLLLGVSGFFFTAILPSPQGAYAFIVVAALGGFGVSTTIFQTKRSHKQLVCPTGSNCNAVVNSRYARFFGIPLEYLGMLYFFFIALAYLALIVFPQAILGPWLLGLAMLSTAAFFFSFYLLFVQAFLLRQWCIWCILAAMFSLTIFFMSLISLDQAVAFLGNMGPALAMLQSLGFVLGMGGSTAAVFLFLKFLRDADIDTKEASVLQGMSELAWLGLGLLLMSHFALFVGNPGITASGAFLARVTALFGVAISAALLMIIFAPFLAYLPFSKEEEKKQHVSFPSLRKAVFITGSVALSSWYFAFATNYLHSWSLPVFLIAYIIVLGLAVVSSLLWEQAILRKKQA